MSRAKQSWMVQLAQALGIKGDPLPVDLEGY